MGISQYFSYFAAALLLSAILVPLMRPLAFRLGAVDRGEGRRVHTGIIPRLGGIAFFMAFFVVSAFSLYRGTWDGFHNTFVGVLLGSAIIALLGFYDDLKGARVSHKLLAEVLAAVIIYAWGIRIDFIASPLGGKILLGWLSLPVTVLWIIVITNAINLIDGLDGLAAGTGIFIAATFFFISGADTHLQLSFVILVGALGGFLIYNFPPASIFMGDSGSLFIGFFLGAMSILSSHKSTALAVVMVPIIAFSLPLLDMVYAVLRRYYRGLPLGEPDREHIHHKLLEKGFSKKTVLVVIYALNVAVMLMALLFISRQVNGAFIGVVFMMVFAAVGLRLLGYVKFIPIVRELKQNFELNRKRKYFNYLIRRFSHGVGRNGTIGEVRRELTTLVHEYGLSTARIYFYPYDHVRPFFEYRNPDKQEDGKPIALTLPIVDRGNYIGSIEITKEMDGEYFLCLSELLNALCMLMHRYIPGYQETAAAPGLQLITPAMNNER
ncbi:MAG: MraY family glycosyltransferase [Nitrospiraceae bacterium]|nr:MraY family glycosyltransferase [Nitrospiraceae bacterium]